ncbi:hypothetical protein JG687_00018574 [Phytophthora cactorum]|uniref:Uncharacterized protein n=1 Tax=Phytophthora cactorum TaxID=29920 RepID=A0A8T1TNM0_9STRA|nr:hypothetical protein JG687_00018574 [Phytophthora cactorum]
MEWLLRSPPYKIAELRCVSTSNLVSDCSSPHRPVPAQQDQLRRGEPVSALNPPGSRHAVTGAATGRNYAENEDGERWSGSESAEEEDSNNKRST